MPPLRKRENKFCRKSTKIDQTLRSGSFEFDLCQKSRDWSHKRTNSIPASLSQWDVSTRLRQYIFSPVSGGVGISSGNGHILCPCAFICCSIPSFPLKGSDKLRRRASRPEKRGKKDGARDGAGMHASMPAGGDSAGFRLPVRG
jgi:hypothetical protein